MSLSYSGSGSINLSGESLFIQGYIFGGSGLLDFIGTADTSYHGPTDYTFTGSGDVLFYGAANYSMINTQGLIHLSFSSKKPTLSFDSTQPSLAFTTENED